MLELHNLREGTFRKVYRGTGNITKFISYTVDGNGKSRNYDFDPEYDLTLYVYSVSPKTNESFREYNVQYGYMYQYTPIETYSFPVFREVPNDDNRKINVWKVSDDSDWDELEVVKVSTNFYAYSRPENRDLSKFLDGALRIIEDHKKKLTDKYNRDMSNQDKIHDQIIDCMTRIIGK